MGHLKFFESLQSEPSISPTAGGKYNNYLSKILTLNSTDDTRIAEGCHTACWNKTHGTQKVQETSLIMFTTNRLSFDIKLLTNVHLLQNTSMELNL